MKYVEAMISIPDIEDEGMNYGGASESMDALRNALTTTDEISGNETVAAVAELIEAEDMLSDLASAIEEHECYSPVIPHLIPVGSTEDINVQMERAGFLNGEVVVILRESDFDNMRSSGVCPVCKHVLLGHYAVAHNDDTADVVCGNDTCRCLNFTGRA